MSEQPSQPPSKMRPLLTVLAVIADLTAVATLWSSHLALAAMVAGCSAVLFGIYAFIRGIKKSVTWGLAALASFGLGTFVLGWMLSGMSPSTMGVTTVDARPSAASTSRTATVATPEQPVPPTTAAAQTQAGAAKQIRLQAQRGIDVEVSSPAAVDADGPNGDLDLYMDESGYIFSNGGNIFNDEATAPEKDAYTRCKKIIDEGKGANKQLPFVGRQFCFRTSSGKTAWARVNAAEVAGKQSFAVLNIRIW